MHTQNLPVAEPTNSVTPRPLPPDQISPKSIVLRVIRLKHVFRRNWKLIVLLTLLGGAIGFLIDRFNTRKPTYQATIMFNLGGGSSSSGLGELGALASAFGLSQSAPDVSIFAGDNFIIFAKSRPVIEKTLMKTVKINGQDTLLVNYYIRHSGIRDKEWEDDDTLRSFSFKAAKKAEDFTRQEAIAMAQIYERISGTGEIAVLQPERKSSFLEMRVSMEDEMLSKTFAETHLATIEEDYRQKQTKKTREMYELLQARADSIARVLNGTENRLAQAIDQNFQVVAAAGQLQQTKLSRNSQFLTQLYFQAVQSVENMRLTLIRDSPLFTVISPVRLPLVKQAMPSVATQGGIILGLLISLLIVFMRETYRSIMQEG